MKKKILAVVVLAAVAAPGCNLLKKKEEPAPIDASLVRSQNAVSQLNTKPGPFAAKSKVFFVNGDGSYVMKLTSSVSIRTTQNQTDPNAQPIFYQDSTADCGLRLEGAYQPLSSGNDSTLVRLTLTRPVEVTSADHAYTRVGLPMSAEQLCGDYADHLQKSGALTASLPEVGDEYFELSIGSQIVENQPNNLTKVLALAQPFSAHENILVRQGKEVDLTSKVVKSLKDRYSSSGNAGRDMAQVVRIDVGPRFEFTSNECGFGATAEILAVTLNDQSSLKMKIRNVGTFSAFGGESEQFRWYRDSHAADCANAQRYWTDPSVLDGFHVEYSPSYDQLGLTPVTVNYYAPRGPFNRIVRH